MKVNQVLCGDAIEVMDDFDVNSIDSLVSDIPYGLGFMGKAWDKFTSKEYQDFCFEWGTRAIKILKPGAYCLPFSAPKKYHRMACGLEDAEFKIKDKLSYMYGMGFPKNFDISLAINKHLGGEIKRGNMLVAPDGQTYDKRKKIGKPLTDYCYSGNIIEEEDLYEKTPTNPIALEWLGWGTGLKPAYEDIALAQKPCEGNYVENILKWGVGALNINACRIDYIKEREVDSRIYNQEKNITRGTHENSTLKYAPDGNNFPMYKTQKGRWPSNLLLAHHPKCKLIGCKRVKTSTLLKNHNVKYPKYDKFSVIRNKRVLDRDYGKNGYDIVKDYNCHSECPIRIMDEQSGISGGGAPKHNREIIRKGFSGDGPYNDLSCGFDVNKCKGFANYGDKGGASRFFYSAKAYVKERNAGCENLYWEKVDDDFKKISKKQYESLEPKKRAKGNPISALKPINLMRYLVRLVTPPGGTVLDPFGGSGTTAIACIIEGFNYILIEKRKGFAEVIIPKRLKWWEDPSHWKILKDHPLLPKIQMEIQKKQNRSLDLWV